MERIRVEDVQWETESTKSAGPSSAFKANLAVGGLLPGGDSCVQVPFWAPCWKSGAVERSMTVRGAEPTDARSRRRQGDKDGVVGLLDFRKAVSCRCPMASPQFLFGIGEPC